MPGRYFRTHPGHGHTPRAILFRDIMLDSSSFLPADILVAIASNPLRQSVSAIRTPRGLLSFLFHLPSSPLHPLLYFRLFFFFLPTLHSPPPYFFPCLLVPLCPSTLSIHFSARRFRPSASSTSFYFPLPPLPTTELNPMLFSFRLFVLFVSSICPVSLFAFRVCPSFHACTSPLFSLSLSVSSASFSTIYHEPRWNDQYISRRKTSS